MVIVGSDMLQRPDSAAVYSAVVSIAGSGAKPHSKDWKTLNVLHRVSLVIYVDSCSLVKNVCIQGLGIPGYPP